MQTLTLTPGQTENITSSTTLLIQNLDPYTNIEVSRFDVPGRWFVIQAESLFKIKGPVFVRNSSNLSLTLVYETNIG